MGPAQIDIGVASNIGRAGKAWGNAIEAIGGAFGELASRVGQADADQAYADAQLETLKGRDAITEDVYGRATEDDTSPFYEVPGQMGELNTNIDQRYGSRMTPKQQREFKQWRNTTDFQFGRGFREKAQVAEVSRFDKGQATRLNDLSGRISNSNDPYADWMQSREIATRYIESAGSRLTAQEKLERRRQVEQSLGLAAVTRLGALESLPEGHPDKIPHGSMEALKRQIESAEKEIDDELKGGAGGDLINSTGELTIKPMPAGLKEGVARARPQGAKSIKGLVMHETSSPTVRGVEPTLEGFVSWSNRTKTGANYYIEKDGTVRQLIPDDQYVYHTDRGRGKSADARPDFQSANTLAIEIVTRKGEKPNAKQIEAARKLTAQLGQKYGFSEKDVYGHGELAVGHRESSEGMDVVKVLREQGFTKKEAEQIADVVDQNPQLLSNPQDITALAGLVKGPTDVTNNRPRTREQLAERARGLLGLPSANTEIVGGSGSDELAGAAGMGSQLGPQDAEAKDPVRTRVEETIDEMIESGQLDPEQRQSAVDMAVEMARQMVEEEGGIPSPDWWSNLQERFARTLPLDGSRTPIVTPGVTTGGAEALGREVTPDDLEAAEGRNMIEGEAGQDTLEDDVIRGGEGTNNVPGKPTSPQGFQAFLAGRGRLKPGQTFTVDIGRGRKFTLTSDDINAMDRKSLKQLWQRSSEQFKVQDRLRQDQATDMIKRQEESLRSGGQGVEDYNPQFIQDALGRNPQGQVAMQRHARNMERIEKVGEYLRDRWDVPDEILEERKINSLRDDLPQKDKDEIERQVNEVQRVRASDPALAAEYTPAMKQVREQAANLTGDRKMQALAQGRLEVQKRTMPGAGPAAIAVLTKAEAQRISRDSPELLSREGFQSFAQRLQKAYGPEIANHMLDDIIRFNYKGDDLQYGTDLLKKFFSTDQPTRDQAIQARRLTQEPTPATRPGMPTDERKARVREMFIRESDFNAAANSKRTAPGEREAPKLSNRVIDVLLQKKGDQRVIDEFNKIYNGGKPGFAERIIRNLGTP